MRILICDDDKIFVSALRQNITECFEKLEMKKDSQKLLIMLSEKVWNVRHLQKHTKTER